MDSHFLDDVEDNGLAIVPIPDNIGSLALSSSDNLCAILDQSWSFPSSPSHLMLTNSDQFPATSAFRPELGYSLDMADHRLSSATANSTYHSPNTPSVDPPPAPKASANSSSDIPPPPKSPQKLSDLFKGPSVDDGPIAFDNTRIKTILLD